MKLLSQIPPQLSSQGAPGLKAVVGTLITNKDRALDLSRGAKSIEKLRLPRIDRVRKSETPGHGIKIVAGALRPIAHCNCWVVRNQHPICSARMAHPAEHQVCSQKHRRIKHPRRCRNKIGGKGDCAKFAGLMK